MALLFIPILWYIFQEQVTKKIIKARNVLFKEDEIQPLSSKEEIYQGERILENPNLDLDEECSNEQTKEKPVADKVGEVGNEIPEQPRDEQEDIEHEALPRENRNRRPPERYGNPYTFNTTQQEKIATEPKT